LTVNVLLSERYGFAQKVFEIELTKKDSYAKAQRRKKTVETRQHFAPLREKSAQGPQGLFVQSRALL
jgi:hypothetical protein